jgi:hypothetical protein
MTARRRGERDTDVARTDGRLLSLDLLDRVLGPVAPRLSPDGHR